MRASVYIFLLFAWFCVPGFGANRTPLAEWCRSRFALLRTHEAVTLPEIASHTLDDFIRQMGYRRNSNDDAADWYIKAYRELLASVPYRLFQRRMGGEDGIEHYLRVQFAPFFDDGLRLRAAQTEELDQQLTLRHAPSGGFGRERLAALSAANVDRILGEGWRERSDILHREEPKLCALADSIPVYFRHNSDREPSTDEQHRNRLPILSARLLQKLGFAEGGANTEDFNRELLRSDGQVFFYVDFHLADEKPDTAIDVYGHQALILDTGYAREAGWISTFVMTQGDLIGDLLERVAGHDNAMTQKNFEEALALEHLTDFTVQDFETLFHFQLAKELARTRDQSPALYERLLAWMESDDFQLRLRVLEHVMKPIGLPRRFELKVPLAVPAGKATHLNARRS